MAWQQLTGVKKQPATNRWILLFSAIIAEEEGEERTVPLSLSSRSAVPSLQTRLRRRRDVVVEPAEDGRAPVGRPVARRARASLASPQRAPGQAKTTTCPWRDRPIIQ